MILSASRSNLSKSYLFRVGGDDPGVDSRRDKTNKFVPRMRG